MTTDSDNRARALAAVNKWIRSLNWCEGNPEPHEYMDSEEVLYDHHETIRRTLEQQSGWQSIDSAPKDKIIFLCNSEYAEYYCRFHKGKWCYWGFDDFGTMSWVHIGFEPTHWHPLPQPPETP